MRLGPCPVQLGESGWIAGAVALEHRRLIARARRCDDLDPLVDLAIDAVPPRSLLPFLRGSPTSAGRDGFEPVDELRRLANGQLLGPSHTAFGMEQSLQVDATGSERWRTSR